MCICFHCDILRPTVNYFWSLQENDLRIMKDSVINFTWTSKQETIQTYDGSGNLNIWRREIKILGPTIMEQPKASSRRWQF